MYTKSDGSFKSRESKKPTNSCSSSTGDPHKQFGGYPGASLQSLLQENAGTQSTNLEFSRKLLENSRASGTQIKNKFLDHTQALKFLGFSRTFLSLEKSTFPLSKTRVKSKFSFTCVRKVDLGVCVFIESNS